MQIEQLSQRLRTKASRLDTQEEAFAANRLLSQQGVNARRCLGTSCIAGHTSLESSCDGICCLWSRQLFAMRMI